MSRSKHEPARLPVVVHVGILGDRPGGIAQVVNQYLAWPYRSIRPLGILSTRGKHDWLSPLLWLVAAARIVWVRFAAGRSAVLAHISAKGSFVREGSLLLLARAVGHRTGVHLHGSQFPAFSKRSPRLVTLVCGRSDVVFVLTDESAAIVDALTEGRGVRVVTINNAVDVPAVVGAKSPMVLFCGEVGRRKGADVLLEAWSSLGRATSGWELVLAGPVSSDFRIGSVQDNVRILGAVAHARSLALQNEAAIAALPSRNEAMPMFLLEAMARGCAVIGTPVGQVADLIGGVGELTEVGNPQSLGDALRKLIDDPAYRIRTGDLARQRVAERYSADRAMANLETEWSRLATGAAVSHG